MNVADDPERTVAMCADRRSLVVDLDDCRTVGDQPTVPHRPHVEGAAPPDDQVGAVDQLGGERRGEPAGHVQRPRVAVEQALGDRRRGDERPGRLGELLEGVPAARTARAAAGDEHRALCSVERLEEDGQVGGAGCDRLVFGMAALWCRHRRRHRLGLELAAGR